MRSEPTNARTVFAVFLITTILAYGLLMAHTGFYWDDWPFAWIAQFLGPAEFIPAFDGVRPFLGPIFWLTTSLIPPVPIYWQIFALVIHFLAGLAAWFALDQIWPQHKRQTLIAALLFLLFPGYSQHWVAFTHINQEWVSLIFYLLSFGYSARALRKPQRFRGSTIMALIFLLLGVFPTEYFASIEVMRFFFIWVIVQGQTAGLKERILLTLKHWLPYFGVWLANVLWLIYFYTLGNYDSYDVKVAREPLSVFQVVLSFIDAIWKAGIYAWGQIVLLIGKTITTPSSLLTVALIGVAFLFFVYYLSRIHSSSVAVKPFAIIAIMAGVTGIIGGRLPSFAAALPLTLQSSWDRLTISMMLGGTLLIVGLLELLIPLERVKTYLFALLIALAVGQQFFNANIFRRDWEKQQEIYSQLAWRIPAMKPGTALLIDELPVDYETDLSFTASLNWMYAPEYTRADLPYALLYVESRLGGGALPSLEPATDIFVGMRAANFYGSTSQVIVIHMPKTGCLRVLDPALGDRVTYARESRALLDAIPLSKPELIDVNSNNTPNLPFLPEAEYTWCYYFAKAELARQERDWQKIIALHEEAMSLNYQPSDPFEWLVFIEAQAITGQLDDALKLSKVALKEDVRIRNGLCQVWRRVQAQGPGGIDARSQVDGILRDFQCSP